MNLEEFKKLKYYKRTTVVFNNSNIRIIYIYLLNPILIKAINE